MLNTSTSASPDAPLKPQAERAHRAFEYDSANEHLRELLRYYGLRTSLIRLKVIDALLIASRDKRALGVRGVHAYLQPFASELPFISVREVLKRLCDEGVIFIQPDKSYSFTVQARAILEQHSAY